MERYSKSLAMALVAAIAVLCSCSAPRSSTSGLTYTEIETYNHSVNQFDLEISPEGITYTIDISTEEGRSKLNGLTLEEAQKLALEEAAKKNNAARIISPKFSQLAKGRRVLRVTVFGFPARYKNSEKPNPGNVIIVK